MAVNVDNKDDVNKIIKIVTQQLGLSVSDFHSIFNPKVVFIEGKEG